MDIGLQLGQIERIFRMESDLIDIAVQVKGETPNAYRVYDGKRTE